MKTLPGPLGLWASGPLGLWAACNKWGQYRGTDSNNSTAGEAWCHREMCFYALNAIPQWILDLSTAMDRIIHYGFFFCNGGRPSGKGKQDQLARIVNLIDGNAGENPRKSGRQLYRLPGGKRTNAQCHFSASRHCSP